MKVYTVKNASSEFFCGLIAESTLYKLVEKNQIPYSRVGGRVIFQEDTLKHWLDEQEQKTFGMKARNKCEK